jgi:acyl-CoA thioesterase FadM
VVWVNTNQKTHKSSAIPQELAEKIIAWEGDKLER